MTRNIIIMKVCKRSKVLQQKISDLFVKYIESITNQKKKLVLTDVKDI